MRQLRPLRYPALAVATALLLAVGIATVWGLAELRGGVDRLEHSHQVLGALDGALGSLRSAESSARGYRRSGMPSMYAEFREHVPQVQAHSERLAALTADNPPQQQRVLQWQDLVAARVAELTALAAGEPGIAGGADQALLEDVRSGGTARVVEQASRIREVEQALLLQRRALIDEGSGRLTAFVVLGIVVPLILLGLLLQGLLRENRRSRRLEREARQAAQAMESSLAERDRLTEQQRLLGEYAGLLQSCHSLDEAFVLATGVLKRLLPGAGGRFYTVRASQSLAESAASFGTPLVESAEVLAPADCWALRRGQPHRSDSRHAHVACPHVEAGDGTEGLWSVCVPLGAQGTLVGMLHVNAAEDAGSDNATALVEAVAEQLGLAIVNLQLRETLRQQSLRDPLTGLFNRRYLEESLDRELARCQRKGLPVSVLMLDIDHFKRFNDEHGHPAGDAMLQKVGSILASLTRGGDIACRYGGEEFTVVLPEADNAQAAGRAEQIRAEIGAAVVTHAWKQLGPATASIGVATFPAHGDTPRALLDHADAALYRAKAQGRNRVVAD